MITFVCPCPREFGDLMLFEEHCTVAHGQEWLLRHTEPQRLQRRIEEVSKRRPE